MTEPVKPGADPRAPGSSGSSGSSSSSREQRQKRASHFEAASIELLLDNFPFRAAAHLHSRASTQGFSPAVVIHVFSFLFGSHCISRHFPAPPRSAAASARVPSWFLHCLARERERERARATTRDIHPNHEGQKSNPLGSNHPRDNRQTKPNTKPHTYPPTMKPPSNWRSPLEAAALLLLLAPAATLTSAATTAPRTPPTQLLSPLAAAAAPSELTCDNIVVALEGSGGKAGGQHKYNLQALGGPHTVVTSEFTAPTWHNTTYTIDVCGALRRKGDVPQGERCPDGTRGRFFSRGRRG